MLYQKQRSTKQWYAKDRRKVPETGRKTPKPGGRVYLFSSLFPDPGIS